jgi:hypothetical protein
MKNPKLCGLGKGILAHDFDTEFFRQTLPVPLDRLRILTGPL